MNSPAFVANLCVFRFTLCERVCLFFSRLLLCSFLKAFCLYSIHNQTMTKCQMFMWLCRFIHAAILFMDSQQVCSSFVTINQRIIARGNSSKYGVSYESVIVSVVCLCIWFFFMRENQSEITGVAVQGKQLKALDCMKKKTDIKLSLRGFNYSTLIICIYLYVRHYSHYIGSNMFACRY